jgi:hypothetical protein
MSVTVDETGEDGHFAEVDDLGVKRDIYVAAHGLDLVVADQDGLGSENRAGVGVDQLAGADGGRLGSGGSEQRAASGESHQGRAYGGGDYFTSVGLHNLFPYPPLNGPWKSVQEMQRPKALAKLDLYGTPEGVP